MRDVRCSARQQVAARTAILGVCGLEKLLSFEGIEPEVRKAFEQRDESMERKTNIGGTEPNEPATPTATSKAAEKTGKVLPRKVGQARRYFVSGWRFARHLLEMVLAMGAGTAVLGVAPRCWASRPATPMCSSGTV